MEMLSSPAPFPKERPERVRFRSIWGTVPSGAWGSSMILRSSRSVPALSVDSTRLKEGTGLASLDLPPPDFVVPSERFDRCRFMAGLLSSCTDQQRHAVLKRQRETLDIRQRLVVHYTWVIRGSASPQRADESWR